jgi:hypothetical protein
VTAQLNDDREGLYSLVTAQDVEAETSRAVGAAFSRYTAERQAQQHMGPRISMIGGCVRRFVYALAGLEATDPELRMSGEHRAANQGTMQHEGMLPPLAAELDAEHERPVVLRVGDDLIPGTADLVSELRRTVWDVKTRSEHGMSQVASLGPSPANRLQTGGYALALHQQGVRIDWVVYLYLDRASGQDRPVAERFSEQLALDVLSWVWLAQSYRDVPHRAPRTERGPGLSMMCDGCEQLRRCWGADARPGVTGPQRDYARTVSDVEAAVAEYARVRARIGELEREKEFWAEVFQHGSRGGRWYGDAYWGRDADGEADDVAAMRKILEDLGIPIPKSPRRGSLRVKVR